MRKVFYIALFSVYLVAGGLSSKPISPTIDHVKDLAIAEMLGRKYSNQPIDKKALKKKIDAYPSPIEMSKMFVKAYLASDDATMLKIVPKEIMDKLKEHDKKVRESFLKIEKYDNIRMVEFEGRMVPVTPKDKLSEQTIYLYMKDEEMQIKFSFLWVDNRWILLKVM